MSAGEKVIKGSTTTQGTQCSAKTLTRSRSEDLWGFLCGIWALNAMQPHLWHVNASLDVLKRYKLLC